MPNAARMTDMVLQDSPHCHAPIHPPAPVPTPVPHPGIPMPLMMMCHPTVLINFLPAATVTSSTVTPVSPCTAICLPLGLGIVVKGSMSVMTCFLPAARLNDITAHATCSAVIPGLTGKIIPPCSPNVIIGG